MADEVEIVNVGGDGVASEVTLKLLIEAVEKMAKSSGKDPKSEAKKVTEAHTKAVRDSIEVIEDETDAREDNTSALRKSTRAMGSLFTSAVGLAGQGFGMATTAAINLTSTLMDTNANLTDFANQIPLVGSLLGLITQPIDESVDSFRTLSKVGGDFGESLEDLRSSAAAARMSISDFASLIQDNSQRLASFGGNVTSGANLISRLSNSMDEDILEQFTALGLNFEEMNEQIVYYQYLNRAGARTRQMVEQEELEATARLTKNMVTLSRLTGEDVRQRQEQLAQAQMDMAFQMEMARLPEHQRNAMLEAMNVAFTEGGDLAVRALQAQFLGMPPLTQELQMYTTLMGENAQMTRELANSVRQVQEGQTLENVIGPIPERIAAFFEAQFRAASQNEQLLIANAVGGMDGIISILGEQMNLRQDVVARYLERSLDGVLEFDTERLQADLASAMRTDGTIDEEILASLGLNTARTEINQAITDGIVNPLTENVLGPLLNAFAESLRSLVGDDSGAEGSLTGFQTALAGIGTFIEGPFTESLNTFMDAFREDPSQAIADLMSNVVDAVADFLLGPNTRMVNTPIGLLEQSIEREGGFLSRIFGSESFIGPIKDGIVSALKEGSQAFTEFWDTEAGTEMKNTIIGFFEDLLNTMQRSFVNSPLGWLLGSNREQIAQSDLRSEGPTDPRAAENFGEILSRYLSNTSSPLTQPQQNEVMRSLPDIFETLSEEMKARIDDIRGNDIFANDTRTINRLLREAINNPQDQELQEILRQVFQELDSRGLVQGGLENLSTERQELLDQLNRSLAGENVSGLFQSEETARENIVEQLQTLNAQIEQLGGQAITIPKFNDGTKGFENFGRGTLAMLHGEEAVVPRDTPHGKFLAQMNDDPESLLSNFSSSILSIDQQQYVENFLNRLKSRTRVTEPEQNFLSNNTMLDKNLSQSQFDTLPMQYSGIASGLEEISTFLDRTTESATVAQEVLDKLSQPREFPTPVSPFDNIDQFIENAIIAQESLDDLTRTREFPVPVLSIGNIDQFIENAIIAQESLDELTQPREIPSNLFSPFDDIDQFINKADQIQHFGFGLDSIATGIENIVNSSSLTDTLTSISDSLDPAGIIEYRKNIELLAQAVDTLNQELSETKALSNLDTTAITQSRNTATPDNAKLLEELNTNIVGMLSLLRQANEINKKVEKNTASSGKDLTTGKISNIR